MAQYRHLQLILSTLASVVLSAELDWKFLKYPESVIAPVGDEVTFECEVNIPAEWLIWRWKGEQPGATWSDVEKTAEREVHSTSTFTRLVVHIGEKTEPGLFQCVVSFSSVILESVPAKLSIARIDTSDNYPEKRVITAPTFNTVVLHCKEPKSEPPAAITWYKETKGVKKQLDTPFGVLVIQNATTEDSGTYGCKAYNDLSSQAVELPGKTYLKVQREGRSDIRFLETEDYVGQQDNDGVLTVTVKEFGVLRLWCGAVSTPPPKVIWTKEGKLPMKPVHDQMLVIPHFTGEDEGIFSCSANGIRRSWKVVALQPPRWEGIMRNLTASEDGDVHLPCGTPSGQPPPEVYWVLNGQQLRSGKGVRVTNTDLFIDHVEKRHAGIVQCFACNSLGCAYDAALLTVIPLQISDQDYSIEDTRVKEYSPQPPKRHNRKNSRKHKPILIPPSRPNVTRLTDESVMVSWSKAPNHGLPILFYKVQYKEASNSSNVQWNTAFHEIPPHIHSHAIDGLTPDKYYRFRVAAVYSNQDNKQGKSSAKFYLQRGAALRKPQPPQLTAVVAASPHSLRLEWTWSTGPENVSATGFYVYYRQVDTAGEYEKVLADVGARSMSLDHLLPDTAYEVKMQAYTAQAPSAFSSIKVAKTLRSPTGSATTSEAPPSDMSESKRPDPLVTAGGAIGAAALLLILVVTLLLCRRAKRVPADKEKGSVPESGANGYIPAKVPITITANPMHSEVAKTLRSPTGSATTSEAPPSDMSESKRPDPLVTAGGAIGAAALLLILVVTLLLCRRAKRVPADKEKGSVPESGANGYIPAKVPITITANPMHSEVAKTLRSPTGSATTSEAPPSDMSESKRPDPLVTAGGAIGAAALLLILVVTLLLCRRAKRVPADKEKGSVPESGANGYIPAKVPITITANPMHSESGDAGVEMAFLHNNNGNNDDTLSHSRKNGPARQYV